MVHAGRERRFVGWRATVGLVSSVIVVALCSEFLGCESETETHQALNEIREGQKKILEEIDEIEKTQKKILAASSRPTRKRPQIDYNKFWDIDIGRSPLRGPKNAKATLVEFSDFQCPYCKRAQPLIRDLLEAFPEDLRHVFKHFPLGFHKRAMPAARACEAARLQDKFWDMQKLVWENPKKLEDENLRGYAKQIGLDMERFDRDYGRGKLEKRIQADIKEGRRIQVTGTPTLFLNGKRVRKRDFDAMKQEIEALLKTKQEAS
jgi:protein-disulfide isomerase